MIRRPPRSTQSRSSAASDVYKRQDNRYAQTDMDDDIAIEEASESSDTYQTDEDEIETVSYTHLRAHETVLDLVCRLLLEKKKKTKHSKNNNKKSE